ncbi:hypothetical protein ARMGADRAFT_1064505 [Armillaria gallica]|uniref:Uncharacterized protein n=1 Tax=Armillaria gallica TaxID=47427 RepID=A0A2H3DSG1_ARMGA|nr:hypothetical protein ARMGADRAFT_1064505 [Armillaria gallica]
MSIATVVEGKKREQRHSRDRDDLVMDPLVPTVTQFSSLLGFPAGTGLILKTGDKAIFALFFTGYDLFPGTSQAPKIYGLRRTKLRDTLLRCYDIIFDQQTTALQARRLVRALGFGYVIPAFTRIPWLFLDRNNIKCPSAENATWREMMTVGAISGSS